MSGNKVVNKQVVVNKRVDINIFAAQFGVLEIQALIQKGFVVDSTQPIRKRGNHIFVELIGTADSTEEVVKAPEQVVIIDDVPEVVSKATVEAPVETKVETPKEVAKPAAKKTTKAKEVKDA